MGGLRLSGQAADLPTALAVVSSLTDSVVPAEMVAFGELGLSGEVRAIGRAADRVAEASKLGFTRIMLPAGNARTLRGKTPAGMKVESVATIQDALRLVMPHGGHLERGKTARHAPRDDDEMLED